MASPFPDLTAAIVREPLVVSPETMVSDAISLMANAQPRARDIDACIRSSCVVVVAKQRLLGLLTERDMVRLAAHHDALATVPIQAVFEPQITPLRTSDLEDVALVESRLRQCRYPLPVLDEGDRLLGLITRESLEAALSRSQDDFPHPLDTPQSYANLVMSAPVGIFRHDAKGNCIYVNDRCCQICGLTPEGAMGERWRERLHPEDRDRVADAWGQFLTGHRPFSLEYRFQHTDDTITWVYTQAVVEQDEWGQVTGYMGTITDISDRKQAEMALAQSEAHQRALLNAIPDLIIRLSRTGTYLEFLANPNFSVIANPNTLLGKKVDEIMPAQLAERRLRYVGQCLKTRSIQVYEQSLLIDDHQKTEEVRVVPYGEDEVLLLVRDITERKQAETQRQQAEQALAQSEAQNRAILAAIPDLLFRVGLDGVYRGYVSPNRDLALVPNEADLVGHSIHDVLPSELADQQFSAVQTAIQTGELQVYEQQVKLLGHLQDEEVRVIRNSDDEALLIIRDITHRKRAEAKRQQAEAALRQSEARNRAILAALPDYLFCVGADGVYRDVVTYKPEITLFPAEFDPVGLSMAEVLPADVAERQLHYLEEVLQTGTLQTYEQQVQIADQVRYEEVRVVKSDADEALFMVRDISERVRLEAERRQAKAALVESEAQNRAILAAIPDLIMVLSPDGIYRRLVNPHVGLDCVPLGVDRIGKHLSEVLSADIAERHLHYIQKAFDTGELQVFEQRIQVGETYQDEEVRAIKSGADDLLLMVRDISDRKQAEQQLQN